MALAVAHCESPRPMAGTIVSSNLLNITASPKLHIFNSRFRELLDLNELYWSSEFEPNRMCIGGSIAKERMRFLYLLYIQPSLHFTSNNEDSTPKSTSSFLPWSC